MKRIATWAAITALGLVACGGNGTPEDGSGSGGGNTGGNGSGAGSTGGSGVGGGTGGASCDGFAEEAFAEGTTEHVSGITVSTLAGSGTTGNLDGDGAAAQFDNPTSVVADNGNLLVSDYNNHQIRRVTAAGQVTTLVSGVSGFFRPFGLTLGSGTLYVQTDWNTSGETATSNGSIWRVDPVSGVATVWLEDVDRNRGLAWFDNRLFVTTRNTHIVRSIEDSGSELALVAGESDCMGFVDGAGNEARFEAPYGMATGVSNDVIFADRGNHAIRRVTADGTVTTIAGNGSPGMNDGSLATAQFFHPIDVAIDGAGLIYVSDGGNQRIRVIDETAATVRTIAGSGTRGFADGTGESAQFYGQEGIEVTSDGQTIYVADGTQGEDGEPFNRIRIITR